MLRFGMAFSILAGVVGCGANNQGPQAASETLSGSSIVADAASLSPIYDRELTEADISKAFGVTLNQAVTRKEFELFLKMKIKIEATDAAQAAKAFLAFSSEAFIPDPIRQKALEEEGLTSARITDGLTPSEYLTYLRIAHGDGRCEGAKAGTSTCPAYVRDFQMSLITNQNGIFNVRFQGPDSQYQNRLTIHRESQANRQTFAFIGASLGQGGHPMAKIAIDPANDSQCSELEEMLGSSSALEKFLTDVVEVDPVVSTVTARQWANVVTEVTKGVKYTYGFGSFLAGKTCSRDYLGKCYEADPNMTRRLLELIPNAASKTSFDCKEIATVVNVLASMPKEEPLDFSKPLAVPYDSASPLLTADELFDFFIALGNGLTNRPDAPFADTLPLADFELLKSSGIYNPEYQMTSQINRYFLKRFVGR